MTGPYSKYDSEFCGSLPLSNINIIQPHGLLIVLKRDSLAIVQASENCTEALGISVQTLVGSLLQQYVNEADFQDFLKRVSLSEGADKVPLRLRFLSGDKSPAFMTLVHVQADCLLLEMEPLAGVAQDTSFIEVYQELKYVMAAINTTSSLEDVCKVALSELKKLSGFDRLMIYRFDEEWNGTVIAEMHEDGMEPYLGLRFPASDVPRQARALYQRSPYRLIPNRNYTPVRLYPVMNSVTSGFTDLSDCNLRGVAGVHLEYLANMGVMASMSTRILSGGKLWGLLSCHHLEEKYLSYEICSVFELLSDVIAAKIDSLEVGAQTESNGRLQAVQAALMERLYLEQDMVKGLLQGDKSLLELLNVKGAAVVRGRNVSTVGSTPSKQDIEELSYWLQSNDTYTTRHWNRLPDAYEPAGKFADTASGLIALPLRPAKGEFLLGFRPEVVQQVDWGGNPNDAIQMEADGKRYHPRNSFKIWQETVRHTAQPWQKNEIETAERFRNFVQEFLLRESHV